VALATNQGVVGSNPAGRAKFAINSTACERELAGRFLPLCYWAIFEPRIAQIVCVSPWAEGFDAECCFRDQWLLVLLLTCSRSGKEFKGRVPGEWCKSRAPRLRYSAQVITADSRAG
jgi:hypothetical protein